MAIIQGSGEASADYEAEKKRKEEQPKIAPVKVYDPENRAASISKAYYAKTGKLPGPAKLYSFISATEGFQREEQFQDLFPDWVSQIAPDPEDITPQTLVVSKSERAFENRLRQKYSPPGAAHRGADVGYDKTAYRLATLTEGAKAPSMLYDEKNQPVLDNVRALQHDPEMKKLVNGVSDVVNPGRLEDLRETFMGKERDQLTSNQRDQLDEMAIFLAAKYDETDKFSAAYDNDLNNVTWDKNFDAFVSRLAFESVAAHALIPDAVGDPNGIKKAQAMKVIEVATHGAVKDTDDIYGLLSYLALRGDTESVYNAGEQMQRFLYEGWVKGRKTGSDRARTAAYAEEFGVYYLPTDVQNEYKNDLGEWMKSLGEPNQVYLKWAEAQAEADKPPKTSRVVNTRFMEDTLLMMADNIAEGDEKMREQWDDDKLMEFAPGGNFKFAEAKHMREVIIPAITDVENKWMTPAGPLGEAVLPALSWVEKQKNKIFLMQVLQSEDAERRGKAVAKGEIERGYGVSDIGDTWSASSAMVNADPDKAFMRAAFEESNIDWREHGTLLWLSDFAWSTAVDMMLDAGIGAAVSGAKTLAVQIGRRTLSRQLERQLLEAQARRAVLSAEKLRLQKFGKVDSPEWLANERALKDAENVVSLVERPVWYDTVATGIARGKQRPDVLKRVFNIRLGGMSPERQAAVKELLARAGRSNDEDEVTLIFNTLRNEHGVRIDPGATWMAKQRAYNRLMSGAGASTHPMLQTVFPNSMRLSDEVADVDEWIDRLGRITNMGNRHGDKKDEVNKRIAEVIDDAWNAADDSARRQVWDDFLAEIELNAKSSVLLPDERGQINRWLRRSGMEELPEGATRWQGFRSFSKQVAKKRTARYTAKTRMYYAKLIENDETRLREIVEGSTVKTAKKKPRRGIMRRINELCDEDVKAAQDALNDAKSAGAAGDEIADLSNSLKEAQLRQSAAREISKSSLGEPWLMGQLAKDLTLNFNVHQFAAFNSGRYGLVSWMHTPGTMFFGAPLGIGPSIAQATAAFRFLAIARAGFFLTVNAGDELFRGAFTGTWGEMLNRAYWKTWWAKAKTTPQYAEVIEDTIVRAMESGDSWGFAHPGDVAAGIPKSADYGVHLNGWLRMQGNDPVTSLFLAFRRNAGESDTDFVARFVAHVKGKIEDPASDEGDIIRDFLERSNRLWRDDFRFADEIAAQNRILSFEEQKAWDAYSEADALLRENSERIAELRKVVGSFGKPGKKFKASWLESRGLKEADLDDAKISREMEDAYRAQVATRRGVGDRYNDLLDLQARRQVLMDDRKAAVKAKNSAARAASKGYGRELPREVDEMMGERARELVHFDKYDGTRRVLRGGAEMSDDEVDEYISAARAAGDEPPPVTAIRPDKETQNLFLRVAENAPKFDKKVWRAIPGPFWALDKTSGMLKRLVYTGKLKEEFDRLISLGFDEDEALSMAGEYAMRFTNRAMYTNSMTAFEYMTKDIVLFQPAFRQFAVFWSKTWAKHPMLLSGLRSKYGSDYPEAVFGDFAWMVPMPFWMQGGLADIALPGLGPGPLLTFRFANYMTGWRRQEDGKWQYTGDTKLDWMGEQIPLLSFMSKSSSPLLWLDDVFDGLGGYDRFPGMTPEDRVTTLEMMGTALVMPLFRDPIARRKYHMNVTQAQMSRGLKPDFDGAANEMLDKPWWYKFFPGFKYPESALAAASRVLSPLGKQRYVPSDIGEVRTDKAGKPIWSSVFGGEDARTMADAWWEWSAAYGDETKMQNVLNKYPKFAKVREYFKLSTGERAEFLRNPDNWYLIPYVTGKKTYSYGLPMIEGELWYQMQNGQTYYKTVDQYTNDVYQLFQTAGWDKTRVKLDRDLKTDLKTAREFAKQAAIAQSVTPQQIKKRMEWYDNWVKGWWENQTAGTATTTSGNVPDDWLELYAQKMGKKPLEWNPIAIQDRYQQSLMTVAQSLYGKKPEDVSKYGVSARYTNSAIYDEKKRKDALRVANALTDLLPAKWQPLFDPTTATSIEELNRLTKESQQYNDYIASKLSGNEWWKLGNVARQMRSVGADLHISDKALNQNVLALDNLYAKYQSDLEGVKEMSDEYKAIRARYLDARDKILSRPGMEVLSGGPVARLAAMYSRGGKLDENYRRHVLATVNKSQINWTDLVKFWMDRHPVGEYDGMKTYEGAVARAAWLSLAVVAQDFRAKMRKTWNDSMNAYGISPDSKAARVYLYKMRDFVTMWGRTSDLFRKQWNEAGGDALLTNSLDNYY